MRGQRMLVREILIHQIDLKEPECLKMNTESNVSLEIRLQTNNHNEESTYATGPCNKR